jgi:hypothetical protein
MNDVAATELQLHSAAPSQAPWLGRRYVAALIVVAAALVLFAVSMSSSFYDGRLAAPLTHDDVNYFVEGIQHLNFLRTRGFFALAHDFLRSSLHAPLPSYQAMAAYLIFGIADWAPYASNIVLVFIFLGFAAYLLRDCPAIVVAAAMACLVAMPLSSNVITEFNPELMCSLFIAIGSILMVRLPVTEAPLGSRFIAAFCFALAFFAHPSASPFTLIALLATVGLAFLRDIAWNGKFRQLRSGIAYSLLNVLLSIWLPALYVVPRYKEYANYFYDAVFNTAQQGIWFAGMSGQLHLGFYLFGPGGQFMFGRKLLVYLAIIALGFVAVWWHKDRRLLARQVELLLLAFLFWLVPTLSGATQYLFASAFGFSIAFMTIIALRSIYLAFRGPPGAIAVSALGVLLLVLYKPSGLVMPNLPRTPIDREFAFRAIDRLNMAMLGNATNYRYTDRPTQVYMTNMGAYAPNMLKYYLLKMDPALNWHIDSKWMDADPRDHIDFIHGSQQDFVIAGEHGNGLTYSLAAGPSEDATFAAMSQDDGYMAIDRFYGPAGREIALFQRRGSFAGWRPISGIKINPSGRADDPRDIPGGVAYLETFAARPVKAELEIEWVGAGAGQKLGIFVNYQKTADLIFDPAAASSSLKQEISLSAGTNDIVLQSDGALTLRYLVIVPQLMNKAPDHGISVISATYGGRCGVEHGNVTHDVAASCDGKTECTYAVKVERLGDPAGGCAKDFAVSYFCSSEATMRHQELPPEAGFGGVLNLNCPRLERDQ